MANRALAVTLSKKLSVAFSVLGLFVTCCGSILLAQDSTTLDRVGNPVRLVGLLITLAALCTFLTLSITERQSLNWPRLRRGLAPGWSVSTMKPSLTIVVARVTGRLLVFAGLLYLVYSALQLLVLMLTARVPLWGFGGLLGFGIMGMMTAMVTFGCGLALCILTDVAERVHVMEFRQSQIGRQETLARGSTDPKAASQPSSE
jgi:hypothetical protein